MRLLADENIPGDAVAALRATGHDVAWIRIEAPGSPDQDVLSRAQQEGRILLTFDKDFGEPLLGGPDRADPHAPMPDRLRVSELTC